MVTKKKRIVKAPLQSIIMTLLNQGGEMTANEISTVSGVSYITVRKYLEALLALNVIKIVGENKTPFNKAEGKKRGRSIRYSMILGKDYGKKK